MDLTMQIKGGGYEMMLKANLGCADLQHPYSW